MKELENIGEPSARGCKSRNSSLSAEISLTSQRFPQGFSMKSPEILGEILRILPTNFVVRIDLEGWGFTTEAGAGAKTWEWLEVCR
jgi:hypothetical protein